MSSFAESLNIISILPLLELLSQSSFTIPALGPVTTPIVIETNYNTVSISLLLFLSLLSFTVVIRTITLICRAKLSARIGVDISTRIFSSLISQDFEWYSRKNSSHLIGYLTTDLDQAVATIDAVIKLIINIALVLFIGSSVAFLAPFQVLCLSILFVFYYIFVFRRIKIIQRKSGQKRSYLFKQSLKLAQESLGLIKDIKLSKYEADYTNKFSRNNFSYFDSLSNISINADIPRFFIEGLFLASMVLIIFFNYLAGIGFDKQIPLVGALSLGAYRLMQPINASFSVLNKIESNIPAINNIIDFLASNSKQSSSDIKLHNFNNHNFVLEFDKVFFSYKNSRGSILNGLSFKIQDGECVAFVGPSGSGKSTAIEVMMGLLKPSAGSVFAFGDDINRSSACKDAWQALITHVPQFIYLCDDTVANNIALNCTAESINNSLLQKCCELSKVDSFMDDLAMLYETVIGERGVRLSGGQRQRIGIARALYSKKPILILDEATSSLDNITEKNVIVNIRKKFGARMIVMIAHRLDTIKQVDKIIFIDKGKTLAVGTYEELINTFEPFQDLINSGELVE